MSDAFGQARTARPRQRGGRPVVPPPLAPAADEHLDEDLGAAFALGALEPAEREQVAFHLRFCPRCAGLVARDLRAVGMLPFAASPALPAPDVKAALFARIAHSQRAAAAASLPVALPRAVTRDLTLPASRPSPAGEAPTPAVPPTGRPARSWSRLGGALSVPLLVALIATGLWGMQLREQVSDQASRVASLEAQVANFGSAATTIQLSPGAAMPMAAGKVVVGADERAGFVQVDLNSDASAGAYELWAVQDGELGPVAELQVGTDGRGQAEFRLDQPFSEYESVQVLPKSVNGRATPDGVVLRQELSGLGSIGSELESIP